MVLSTHKNSIRSGICRDDKNVKKCKLWLAMIINMIFFANETLTTITSEEEVPNDVAQHMISFANVKSESVKTFVEKRLVKEEISVLDKITKNRLTLGTLLSH